MKSIDNHKIIYKEKKVSTNVVVLIHGITSSKDEGGFYIELSKKLNREGFSTIRFDFRGHGESDVPSRKITISGMIADLFAFIKYAETNYSSCSIVAASFGASIFLLLIENIKRIENIKSVVFLNPVTNYIKTFTPEYSKWASSFFPKGGFEGLLSNKTDITIGTSYILNPVMGIEFFLYKPYKVVWPTNIPLLTLHGEKDNIVSIQDSIDYKKYQANEMKLIEYKNAEHGLEEVRNEVLLEVVNFIKFNMNE